MASPFWLRCFTINVLFYYNKSKKQIPTEIFFMFIINVLFYHFIIIFFKAYICTNKSKLRKSYAIYTYDWHDVVTFIVLLCEKFYCVINNVIKKLFTVIK